jgi:hypothetical protein
MVTEKQGFALLCTNSGHSWGAKCPQAEACSTSGGFGMLFLVFVAGEIEVLRAFETAFPVDGGVDLVIRKNEPIFGRVVW